MPRASTDKFCSMGVWRGLCPADILSARSGMHLENPHSLRERDIDALNK